MQETVICSATKKDGKRCKNKCPEEKGQCRVHKKMLRSSKKRSRKKQKLYSSRVKTTKSSIPIPPAMIFSLFRHYDGGDWDNCTLIGVFSSKRKAEKAAGKHQFTQENYGEDCYYVVKSELDSKKLPGTHEDSVNFSVSNLSDWITTDGDRILIRGKPRR